MRLITAAVALLVVCSGFAQVTTDDPYKVIPIMDKLAELDLANRVLPLLMTRDQINKLLPEIEKARKNVRAQEKKEADRLKAMLPEIDKYHEEVFKGKTPSKDFLDKVTALFKKFESERLQVKVANALILSDAVKKYLDEGQLQAMVGVVDKIYDEQSKEWKGGTKDQKIQFYVISIFMGDRCYDLLVRLSK